MTTQIPGSCTETILIARDDVVMMLKLVRSLHALSKNPRYIAHLRSKIPVIAQLQPPHEAVLMGYDFHIGLSGPRLIEVNTNAGGLWLACKHEQEQAFSFPEKLANRLLAMFKHEFNLWSKQAQALPRAIAIIDDEPEQQFLYPEMQAYAQLLQQAGITTYILAPTDLTLDADGLSYQGQAIDLVYNRHCDFYLQSPAMDAVRSAWLQQQICLTPNPHTYALLADKRRLIDWSDATLRAQLPLSTDQRQLLQQMIPLTQPLNPNLEAAWEQRKHWVFKPDTSHASRGVYVGKKLTLGKLEELPLATTLMQEFVPPSITLGDNGEDYKTDFRLFVYQNRPLALAARLYQGQVTNLRTEGGGFAAVKIV